MKSKHFAVAGMVVLAIAIATTVFAANPVKLIVNGENIQPDVPSQIINGRTMFL